MNFYLFVKNLFLIFDNFKKIHNKNYLEIKKDSFEEEIYNKFGHKISVDSIENIEEHILFTRKKFEEKKK